MARLDSWLWAVRVYKTRSQATAAVRGGHVRVDDHLCKASQVVVPGQVIRVRRDQEERLIEVLDASLEKRVGAPVARAAYVDRTPERPAPILQMSGKMAVRDRGAGRPTARERRQIAKFTGRVGG